MKESEQMKKLETMTAEQLQSAPYSPVPFLVDELIPEGLHILAGAPKGDICFAVCGKLSPRDGSAVPLILGIDAYVRSEAPRTVAADFTPAPTESSRLTVFAFVAARRKAL